MRCSGFPCAGSNEVFSRKRRARLEQLGDEGNVRKVFDSIQPKERLEDVLAVCHRADRHLTER